MRKVCLTSSLKGNNRSSESNVSRSMIKTGQMASEIFKFESVKFSSFKGK